MANSVTVRSMRSIFQTLMVVVALCRLTLRADAAKRAAYSSAELELPAGFKRTLAEFVNSSHYGTHVYNTGPYESFDPYDQSDPGLDTGYVFIPILSSSGYINFNSSRSSKNNGYGFAFGLVLKEVIGSIDPALSFVLCAGFIGNSSSKIDSTWTDLYGLHVMVYRIIDGYCVPLWVLETGGPTVNLNASLVVLSSEDDPKYTKPQLQLLSGNKTALWSVDDVGKMKIRKNGTLVIYDSALTKVVWWSGYQINNSPFLFPGQKLLSGQQLMSNDSIFSLRLLEKGLSFNLNTVKHHDSSYIFVPFNSTGNDSVCTQTSTYVTYIHDGSQIPAKLQADIPTQIANSMNNFLFARSCSGTDAGQTKANIFVLDSNGAGFDSEFNYSFVELESDGYLYLVGVILSVESISITRFKLNTLDTGTLAEQDHPPQAELWPGCESPTVCGPMGVCNAGVCGPMGDCYKGVDMSSCSCLSLGKAFALYNESDLHKGCRRVQPLPNCSNTSASTSGTSKSEEMSFLQLNNTASVMLFSQSPYFRYDLNGSIDQCKDNCSSACQCQGFFFDPNVLPSGGCYFINEDIGGLLNISLDVLKYYPSAAHKSWEPFFNSLDLNKSEEHKIITFLKIISVPTPSQTSQNNITPTTSQNKINIKLMVFIITSSFIIFFIILAIFAYLMQRKKRKLRNLQILEEKELQSLIPSMVTRFSYKDLHKSTDGFNDNNVLGVGGCGAVYKGSLVDGRLVAVKLLGFSNVLTKEQTKQFIAELACVGSTSHYNIVRLLGFCWENSQLLVAYEYLEKGSLDLWLFRPRKNPPLDWKTRFNIAIGIAQGMHYLHEECTTPILHLDIKPQNILLDEHFVPKLADFGLSKLVAQRDISHVITGVRGTPGYIAPEWVCHGAVSKKADVYSMGMVLLEIVSGRRNVDLSLLDIIMDENDTNKWYYPSWAARMCEQGLMTKIVDEELHGAIDDIEVQRVVFTAFWCINEDPCVRPSTGLVLQWLNGVSTIPTPNFSSMCAYERSHMKPPSNLPNYRFL